MFSAVASGEDLADAEKEDKALEAKVGKELQAVKVKAQNKRKNTCRVFLATASMR